VSLAGFCSSHRRAVEVLLGPPEVESEMPVLVAVGRWGMGGGKRLALGSVSTDTLRATSRPVLIV
jgi:nucleotide-binding universal stress UspA family protein